MRSLVQPLVLKSAAAGAAITTVASCPRLILWTARPHQLWLLTLTLAWASFFLWSFVFGWYPKYTGQPALIVKTTRRCRSAATLAGLLGAVVLVRFIDPVLRPLIPDDYPGSAAAWLAATLFILAFEQLFFCLAPFAFFLRLSQRPGIATGLTVLFGAFLLYLKMLGWAGQFSSFFILELFAWRLLTGFLSVTFFLKGGALLNAWWIFLLQIRHLVYLWTPAN